MVAQYVFETIYRGKKIGQKGGEVIRSSGYIYIKGGGAYWDSITATFARHAIPTPRNLAILRAATFPFLLEERTGALAPAVNCTPVIRSKAAVLSAPGREMDARSLFRSNRSRRRGFPSLMEISAAEFIRGSNLVRIYSKSCCDSNNCARTRRDSTRICVVKICSRTGSI